MFYQVTEPILEPILKLVPPLGGVMDISILIAFFSDHCADPAQPLRYVAPDPMYAKRKGRLGSTRRPFSCATALLDMLKGSQIFGARP